MVSVSENQARVVEFILRNFTKSYNINQIAKELKLSPMGSYKILKKLEKEHILKSEKLGNAIFYKIDFESDKAIELCRFILTEKKVSHYVKIWMEDLQPLRNLTQLAVLFGSILIKGKKARDLDLLLVFKKENFKSVQAKIAEINSIRTTKIHDIVQTEGDLTSNLKKKDKVVLGSIQKGVVLWGQGLLLEVIKNAS